MTLFRMLLLLLPFGSIAQSVPRAIVLEHFTNTVCSICANRNPSLHQNLQQNTNVLALSIHPSSPYASCFLSQHNTVANDARTNFYNIYGGTPRIVINGLVQAPGVAFGNAQIFQQFQGQFSAFQVAASLTLGNGQVQGRTVVYKVDSSLRDSLWLFQGLAEDTIWMNGGNGESAHYRVVRRAIQQKVVMPSSIGDSMVFTQVWPTHIDWDLSRLFQFAILQDESKAVEQAAFSALLVGVASSASAVAPTEPLAFYPQPARNFLYYRGAEVLHFELYDLSGRLHLSGRLDPGAPLQVRFLPVGLYILRDQQSQQTYRIMLQ